MLIIDGIGEALRESQATKIYVSNLVTKKGQTEGFTVADHADEIERFAGGHFLDFVLYNRQQPNAKLAERYRQEDAYLVDVNQDDLQNKHYESVGGAFWGV